MSASAAFARIPDLAGTPADPRVRKLTHVRVGPLVQGLVPLAFSADGARLLAEFEGEDTSEA